jgi:1,4-dihydroxy-6-naphthoate synthase
MKLKLGISTCPNDTFIYEHLIAGLENSPFEWLVTFADVQTLNEMVLRQELDVAKVSCGVLPLMDKGYQILSCGGAMGYGCGPLLLSSGNASFHSQLSTLLPGKNTTAALLFKYWILNTDQGTAECDYALFDAVYRDLLSKKAVQGVVIHEHRFTWQRDGLFLLQDLGTFWEQSIRSPVPLGCSVARKSLGLRTIEKIEHEIQVSLALARARPDLVTAFIRDKAQIAEDSIMEAHIRMFVTDFSYDMGTAGERAIQTLLRVAQEL